MYIHDVTDTCKDCPTTEIYALGWCHRCYQRDYMRNRRQAANPYRRSWIASAPGLKICRNCTEEKPTSEFGPRVAGKDGLQSHCKDCESDARKGRRAADPEAREKERAYEKRPEVAARIRAKNAARQYGIPVEQFEAMEKKQAGRCAVCNRERKLAVDHCHASDAVRELLCYPCNIALGQVNDDVDLLKKLISYVEKHRQLLDA